jgi:anti-sigma B factor antagonist
MPTTDEYRILPLEGEIDLHISPQIAVALREIIQEKPRKVVVDLSKVGYIDSSGLAVLIEGMQKVEAYGGKLYLVALRENVRAVFETMRLDQAFRILPDVAAARATEGGEQGK